MNQSLSKSAKSLQSTLKKHGLDCKVIEIASSARTAQDAANSIGCTIAQVVKSLIFKTITTNKPVLVLASGLNKVNEKVIESYTSEPIVKADAKFTKDITGFAIGGIPPVGHKQPIDFIFIDQDLVKLNSLWVSAGTSHVVFNITAKDLLAVVPGKVINLNSLK
jgi:prolyl-tRNA editing enzyme YbaK/EbsC (Cys-tRNA(Pro) deacylase)